MDRNFYVDEIHFKIANAPHGDGQYKPHAFTHGRESQPDRHARYDPKLDYRVLADEYGHRFTRNLSKFDRLVFAYGYPTLLSRCECDFIEFANTIIVAWPPIRYAHIHNSIDDMGAYLMGGQATMIVLANSIKSHSHRI